MTIKTHRAQNRHEEARARLKRKRHYRVGARRADDATAMLRAEQTRRLQVFLDLVRVERVAMPDGGEAMVAPLGLVSALGAMRNRRALIVRAFACQATRQTGPLAT